MYKNFHLYLNFNWSKYEDKNYLKQICQILELAYQHKLTVFYDNKQIEEFKELCDLDENFLYSNANMLHVLLQDAYELKSNYHYLFLIIFSQENTSLNHYLTLAIKELQNKNKALLLLNENNENKKILFVNDKDFEKIELLIIDNKDSLLNWIQNNSTRNFNLSSKHGDDGKNKWSNNKGDFVSTLLCNKKEAQKLLNTAIPDFREQENRLFNFDSNHETFIEFYYEGDNPQMQWHGFHIEINQWENRIPESIKKFFGKNKS
jgi:hypothetical protein